MVKSTYKWLPGVAARTMDGAVERVVSARLSGSVQVSRNHRVRLAQGLGTVCRQVIVAYLDDEQRSLSAAFDKGVLNDGFAKRHADMRRLTDQLYELNPAQDTGLGLLGGIANALEEYVGWEENVLYPSIETMLKDNNIQISSDAMAPMEVDLALPVQNL